MFIKCFSKHVEPKQYWIATFYFQNTIRAILLEDSDELGGMPASQMREELMRLGENMGFPSKCPEPRPPESWVNQFFNREIPQISTLLENAYAASGFTGFSANDYRLALNKLQLKTCVQTDENFRQFLSTASSLWMEE